jgi:hypothetical protein
MDFSERGQDREPTRSQRNVRLWELVPNEEMYGVMENFLLGDPETQVSAWGGVNRLLREGSEAKIDGYSINARTLFETAAKIELYNQNGDGLKKCLKEAQLVTIKGDEHDRLQRLLLANTDVALQIAREYYQKPP